MGSKDSPVTREASVFVVLISVEATNGVSNQPLIRGFYNSHVLSGSMGDSTPA